MVNRPVCQLSRPCRMPRVRIHIVRRTRPMSGLSGMRNSTPAPGPSTTSRGPDSSRSIRAPRPAGQPTGQLRSVRWVINPLGISSSFRLAAIAAAHSMPPARQHQLMGTPQRARLPQARPGDKRRAIRFSLRYRARCRQRTVPQAEPIAPFCRAGVFNGAEESGNQFHCPEMRSRKSVPFDV